MVIEVVDTRMTDECRWQNRARRNGSRYVRGVG
jgi:hypothetical protein